MPILTTSTTLPTPQLTPSPTLANPSPKPNPFLPLLLRLLTHPTTAKNAHTTLKSRSGSFSKLARSVLMSGRRARVEEGGAKVEPLGERVVCDGAERER